MGPDHVGWGRLDQEEPVKIRIIGTEHECQVASDRIARILNVRNVPRPSYTGDGEGRYHYRVQFDAQLRKEDRED
jgi:hypothetical protein